MPEIPDGYANVLIPAKHDLVTRPAAVTFGIRNDVAASSPAVIAELIWDEFATNVLPLLDTDVTWGPVHVQLGVSGGVIAGDGSSSDNGGATIDSVLSNAAVLVRKASLFPGRHGRGRYYWPWAADEGAVSEGGLWNDASAANFDTGQEGFRQGLTDADVPMVILRSSAGTPATVTGLSTQRLLATQRRRMRP